MSLFYGLGAVLFEMNFNPTHTFTYLHTPLPAYLSTYIYI